MFVIQTKLVKRGKVKDNLDIWNSSAFTVLGRESLCRESFMRGNTVFSFPMYLVNTVIILSVGTL